MPEPYRVEHKLHIPNEAFDGRIAKVGAFAFYGGQLEISPLDRPAFYGGVARVYGSIHVPAAYQSKWPLLFSTAEEWINSHQGLHVESYESKATKKNLQTAFATFVIARA